MIERDGRFTWSEDRVYDGVRQSASERVKRNRLIRNFDLYVRGALSKCLGIRRLYPTALSGESYGGVDVRFQGGTQAVLQQVGTEAYLWNTATEVFDAQSQTLAATKPCILTFNDKAILMNGTQFKSMTSAGTWTTVANSPPAAKFGTVHAERLCVAGVAGSEHLFYPSAIRNEESFDVDDANIVEVPSDPGITNMGRLGHLLIVQTRNATLGYFLGSDNPRDWDHGDVSMQIGSVNFASWVEVSRGKGDNEKAYAFFWDPNEGPFMLAAQGGAMPQLVPLWDPLNRCVRGQEIQDFPAIEVTRSALIEGVYAPQYNQVRFGVTKSGSAENDFYLAVDVDSAIAFAAGQLEYPYWVMRDNVNLGYFPTDAMFNISVDADGKPSATGQARTFGARNGLLYEMDSPSIYTDDGESIPVEWVRSGYTGQEDGVQNWVKSLIWAYVHATQVGSAELYVDISSDGGQVLSTATLSLDKGLTKWDESTWDGGRWNDGEFVPARGDFGVNGQSFTVRIYDNGNIMEQFQLDGLELSGYMEDRR